MRILQLDLGDQRIEFHPYVTVLRGFDHDLRRRLIDALGEVALGRPTISGLVEAHGVVLDLTAETLALLDLAPSANGGFDIVVKAEQLPGFAQVDPGDTRTTRRVAMERVARAEAEMERANLALRASRDALRDRSSGATEHDDDSSDADLQRLASRRRELEAHVGRARAEHERAKQDQITADERVEQARALRAESARACSIAAGALEAARGARDPFAASALEAARERLAALEAAAARVDNQTVVEDEFTGDLESLSAELGALENRRLEIEAALLALDTVDPFPVQVALTQLLSADTDGELVPSEDAMRLADEWASISARIGDDHETDSDTGSAIAVARRRLDAARAAVFDAERAVRLPEVDRDEVELLENAHEEVLVAQDRTERRLAGGRAKQRLDDARAAEQEILDRLGFRTYTEFVLGTSIVNVDPEREHRLDVAREELAAAEDALAELQADVDAELARAGLVARRHELREQAVALLGRDPGPDVEWALRHHRVRVEAGTDRADRLQAALLSAGVALGDDTLPKPMLLDFATIWLEEQRDTGALRDQLEHELSEVEAKVVPLSEAVRSRRDAPSTEELEDEANERAARRATQLEEARAAVRVAEQRLERQDELEAEIAQRRSELESATQTEGAVAAALYAAEEEAATAAEAEHAAATERARREADLAAAIEAERRASEMLGELTSRLSRASSSDDHTALEDAVAEAEAKVAAATSELDAARAALGDVDDGSAEDLGSTIVNAAGSVEELEWYLLSRIAAQRSVSYAGSVPLVLDDALAAVRGQDLVHLLSRLERMSTAVQVIVVSEDDQVAGWAESVGTDRAMTLHPLSA